ncbi:MAG: gamma-glutamyl-gamma-aminobutyrate hydrolase family protein [Treponema sp.]|nr:gamma-glutamyl-gamma-aminobutyrate hydrolase family protein [Treponema sp.]
MGVNILTVNSRRCQGITKISPEFTSMAQAEDSLIEADYIKGKVIVPIDSQAGPIPASIHILNPLARRGFKI